MIFKYEKELEIARKIAIDAGEILESYFRKNLQVSLKNDRTEVTKADIESNQFIISELKRKFPRDSIVSEELEDVDNHSERIWYIDPLDGTTHFIDGTPEFAIHIGLAENRKAVLGVVYNPITKELYSGSKEGGAYKDFKGQKVRLNISQPLNRKLIAAVSPVEKDQQKVKEMLEKLNIEKGLKFGSTGLKIMKVAEGTVDIHVPVSLRYNSWDICAPQAILEFANGYARYISGKEVLYTVDFRGVKENVVFARSEKLFVYIQQKLEH